ncbi:hypothetical protein pdam_00007391 [Pocillopora damicornis]|uniref:Ephrin RBD domain-containing protein n=1 Tax=Pocillopora damicornis TaxID=46731 RepID=A0A3M6V5Q4_POCDA|nr:hypothetical protein pdam_00007391 [Pocillopora damicornis]
MEGFYLLLLLVELSSLVGGAVVYPSLQWNFKNPQFQEGKLHFSVLPGSKLNLICPHVAVSFVEMDDTDSMLYYENVWRVDNTSYQTCEVNTTVAENKMVLKCADPRKIQFTTVVFQRFSAVNSLVFEPGSTYYFISTSNGSLSSLTNDRYGHCHTANMKLEIHVCTGTEDPECKEASNDTTTVSTEVTTSVSTPIPGAVGTKAARSSSFWGYCPKKSKKLSIEEKQLRVPEEEDENCENKF